LIYLGAAVGIFLMAIIWVVVMSLGTNVYCTDVALLHPNEQAVCEPSELEYKWKTWYSNNGTGYAHVYSASNNDLAKINRFSSYHDRSFTVQKTIVLFPIASALEFQANLTITTESNKRSSLRVYLVNSNDYDRKQEFKESSFASMKLDFENVTNTTGVAHLSFGSQESGYFYLIFLSYLRNAIVTARYDLDINYTVYDLVSVDSEGCGQSCSFPDMKKEDKNLVIIDYPSAKSSEPESIAVEIARKEVDYGLLFGILVVFIVAIAGCLWLSYLEWNKSRIEKQEKKLVKQKAKAEKNKDTPMEPVSSQP